MSRVRLRVARNRFFLYVAVAVVAAALSFVRTPYSLILPGRALDLHGVVDVGGRAAPAGRLYMTDVTFVPRVSVVGLIDAVIPGARIVRTGDIVPSGVSTRQFDLGMDDAMLESQEVAAVVAERAAGYRVPVPRSRLIVVRFAPASLAKRELRPGDVVVAVGGRPVESRSDLERTLGAVSPGKFVDVTVSRGNALRRFRVATIAYDRRTALGVYLGALFERANLPVPVRYSVHAISGSSGGLMFALQIYETLKHSAPRTPVAGTGTLGYDGIVGAIEGARQKLVAARRAGATVFLVPQENYPEIAGTTGIRIVPVKTFAQALRAIE